ncbi:hypothetical protein [Streptomyces sp. ST2-7A]|uniref:hypothetical protein n=1 Tax=Streptomyces sp. ST2-7A TaxID=2907214 RepID=UPI001F2546C0|nr:hypothetical protein [Streptomyces sp. ST2-7A]MCE7081202.1 hypothetical protein [Streptomyces sp. ST2-7A]
MSDTPAARMRDAADCLTRPHSLVADPLRPALAAWLRDAAEDAEQIGPNPHAGTVADAILAEPKRRWGGLTLNPANVVPAPEPPPRIIPVPVDRHGRPLR